MIDKSALRILVLDDEPFMLKLLDHVLTSLGFSQVTTCDSGCTCQGAIGFIAD